MTGLACRLSMRTGDFGNKGDFAVKASRGTTPHAGASGRVRTSRLRADRLRRPCPRRLIGPCEIPIEECSDLERHLLVDERAIHPLHGQGLVFAPIPLVLPLFRTHALRPVLPECVSQPARIFIHYASRKHLPARVKAFVKFMLERLRGHPDLTSNPQALIAPFVSLPREPAMRRRRG